MSRGFLVPLTLLAFALPVGGQQPPELREELEVRELPVLVAATIRILTTEDPAVRLRSPEWAPAGAAAGRGASR